MEGAILGLVIFFGLVSLLALSFTYAVSRRLEYDRVTKVIKKLNGAIALLQAEGLTRKLTELGTTVDTTARQAAEIHDKVNKANAAIKNMEDRAKRLAIGLAVLGASVALAAAFIAYWVTEGTISIWDEALRGAIGGVPLVRGDYSPEPFHKGPHLQRVGPDRLGRSVSCGRRLRKSTSSYPRTSKCLPDGHRTNHLTTACDDAILA